MNLVDITFDFRSDSSGRDPDSNSATLKSYHKKLWSKPLPNGDQFNLQDDLKASYLFYQSQNKFIELSSDSIIHSYKNVKKMRSLLEQVNPADVEDFRNLGCTIGGFILFPSSRINGKMNINGARGFSSKIGDRFDLTLECIRRHYKQETSPLSEVLNRYQDFFGLFGTFEGYTNFFLLNDLTELGCSSVKFFLPTSEPFANSPYPQNVVEYLEYMARSMDFVSSRNARIATD
jgi:hypothetical protein